MRASTQHSLAYLALWDLTSIYMFHDSAYTPSCTTQLWKMRRPSQLWAQPWTPSSRCAWLEAALPQISLWLLYYSNGRSFCAMNMSKDLQGAIALLWSLCLCCIDSFLRECSNHVKNALEFSTSFHLAFAARRDPWWQDTASVCCMRLLHDVNGGKSTTVFMNHQRFFGICSWIVMGFLSMFMEPRCRHHRLPDSTKVARHYQPIVFNFTIHFGLSVFLRAKACAGMWVFVCVYVYVYVCVCAWK